MGQAPRSVEVGDPPSSAMGPLHHATKVTDARRSQGAKPSRHQGAGVALGHE